MPLRPYVTREQRDWLRAEINRLKHGQIERAKAARDAYWAAHPEQYEARQAAFRRANEKRRLEKLRARGVPVDESQPEVAIGTQLALLLSGC